MESEKHILDKLVKYYIGRDDSAKLYILFSLDPKIGNKSDKFGKTFLHRAATGAVKCTRVLIEHGGGKVINLRDSDGKTALHVAAHAASKVDHGHGNRALNIMQILFDAGIDPMLKNNSNQTALEMVKYEQLQRQKELQEEYVMWRAYCEECKMEGNYSSSEEEEEEEYGGWTEENDRSYDFKRVIRVLEGKK